MQTRDRDDANGVQEFGDCVGDKHSFRWLVLDVTCCRPPLSKSPDCETLVCDGELQITEDCMVPQI